MPRFSLFCVLIGLGFVLTTTPVQAVESAKSFSSEIVVNQDTSLSITETIQYQTDQYKHGIYRYIPIRYSVNGTNQTARVVVESVVDDHNRPHQYEVSKSNDNLTLKIGDPDRTFTGSQTYVISYRVQQALQRYADHDELFWDITGEGWSFPLNRTTVTLSSNFAPITQLKCYSGPVGSDDHLCRFSQKDEHQAVFAYNTAIEYGDNMTIAVGFSQPNHLVFPSVWQQAGHIFVDNAPLLLLTLPAVIMTLWWWQKGRDTAFVSPNVFNFDSKQPVYKVMPFSNWRAPIVYEPLKDLTPGESGTVIDKSSDNQDVVAEILELARKKFLKIERIEKKKFLGTESEYVFTQLKPANSKLPDVQKYLQEQLFAGRESVKLSTLKGSFFPKMNRAKTMLNQSLMKRQLFQSNPKNTRELALAVMAIMGSVTFFFLINLLSQGLYWGVPIFGLSMLVAIGCAFQLPGRTAAGHNYALQARGLRDNIANGKWRQEIQEKHLYIENIFPFAVALGVVQKLTQDMAALELEPPSYINHIPAGLAFNSWVSDFTTQASSSMSYNPSSSSRSGGSGFSGGSSGGGGGGGGGGSW